MILASPDVVEPLLRPWPSRGDLGLHVPKGTPSSMSTSITAELIDAICMGRPFSELTVFCNAGRDQCRGGLLAYSSGFLSLFDRASKETILYQLKTGITKIWTDLGWEQPYNIRLSEKLLVVAMCTGRVWIYNHLTGDECNIQRRLELPQMLCAQK